MDNFNNMLSKLKNSVDATIDTDTGTGTFGNIESEGAEEAPSKDKLVLYLDSGVEIHIPTAIHEQMIAVMAGETQTEVPVVTTMMGAEAQCDGHGGGNVKAGKGLGKGLGKGMGDGPLSPDEDGDKSDCEDNNAKDCPFEKNDEDNDNKKDEE